MITHGGSLFRTHPRAASPFYFGRTGRNRFDDPLGQYSVLYAARDVFGAFIETFGQQTGVRSVGVGESGDGPQLCVAPHGCGDQPADHPARPVPGQRHRGDRGSQRHNHLTFILTGQVPTSSSQPAPTGQNAGPVIDRVDVTTWAYDRVEGDTYVADGSLRLATGPRLRFVRLTGSATDEAPLPADAAQIVTPSSPVL